MGKRSNYDLKPMQKYYTPYEAVVPLLRFLPPHVQFAEPCAGDGRLIRHLEQHGHACRYACDIAPEGDGILQADVLFFGHQMPSVDMIITNPPWDREPLHQMIHLFAGHADTWLLFDADWIHTKQASKFQDLCKRVVSIGRVSWMDNGQSGMDNCCWYEFSMRHGRTEFYFR